MTAAVGERFLTSKQVHERYGNISRMTLWRWVKAGNLPEPGYIGKRQFWREDALPEPRRP
jgi:predicted DNA-binding transcriptional regulator AlpA